MNSDKAVMMSALLSIIYFYKVDVTYFFPEHETLAICFMKMSFVNS